MYLFAFRPCSNIDILSARLPSEGECVFFTDFLSMISFANELYANISDRALQGALESYAGTRFYWKPGCSRSLFGRIGERAHYAGGFGRIEDSRVEKACLVLGVGSDGERI